MQGIAERAPLLTLALVLLMPLGQGHGQESRRTTAISGHRSTSPSATARSSPSICSADQKGAIASDERCRWCGCTRRTTGGTYRGGVPPSVSGLRAAACSIRLPRRRRRLPRRLRVVWAEPRVQPRGVARRGSHGRVRHHRVVRQAAVEQRADRHVGLLGHRRQPDAGSHDRTAICSRPSSP